MEVLPRELPGQGKRLRELADSQRVVVRSRLSEMRAGCNVHQ